MAETDAPRVVSQTRVDAPATDGTAARDVENKKARSQPRSSLAAPWSLAVGAIVVLAVALSFAAQRIVPDRPWAAASLVLLVMLPVVLAIVRARLRSLLAIFRALSGTVTSYRDRDFAFGLHWPRNDEVADLVAAHNELGDVLRAERLDLIQRELLLDTMVQNTPVAMLVVADRGAIVFSNIAARQLLNGGRRLEGQRLDDVLARTSQSLAEAIARGGDGLFTVSAPEDAEDPNREDETYHLARRSYSLNGREHELFLLRHLTVELRRQEVQTWKKVIRVISHELNNSLAPVASLANSGAELVRRGRTARLPEILATIAERTRHLESFIEGYARFAKLPAPRKEPTRWAEFVSRLQAQIAFEVAGALPEETTLIDRAQLEQALLNLLKNAHESGSPPSEIKLGVRRIPDGFVIDVCDRGPGMSETVMANALVPFYSTKRSGTGLGLALAREIVEAHGGRITINNRREGGLVVALLVPAG
jgi:nitrogen fixation/metabolism regulation signal transduction histidine kinase